MSDRIVQVATVGPGFGRLPGRGSQPGGANLAERSCGVLLPLPAPWMFLKDVLPLLQDVLYRSFLMCAAGMCFGICTPNL